MPSSATELRRRPQSRARRRDRADAAVDRRATSTRPSRAATAAFPGWSETPPVVRARAMFRFKALLEEHFEELARLVTTEHGKTLDESRGSVRRGIECVEVACGGPSMLMGYGLENVAAGIDCTVDAAADRRVRRDRAVQLSRRWCRSGSCRSRSSAATRSCSSRPSRCRCRSSACSSCSQQCDLPPGVVNLVHGGREVVEAICDHPGIRAVSFVGSTPVARLVYQRATHAGKRVQALGGAKNFIDRHARRRPRSRRSRSSPSRSTAAPASAAWPAACSCRWARRTPRRATGWSRPRAALKVGDGLEPGVDMGPVISAPHRERVLGYVEQGVSRRRAPGARRPRHARCPTRRLLRRPDGVRRGVAGHGDRPRGDLRPGGHGRAR